VERFLDANFDAPETVLMVAGSSPGASDLGLCLSGPFVDPLSGERLPMVLVLSVDPSVRHRGLARAMLDELREILHERSFAQLAARTAHGDDARVSMGERLGLLRAWEILVRE